MVTELRIVDKISTMSYPDLGHKQHFLSKKDDSNAMQSVIMKLIL